ncbi:site-specific integrase [Halorarum salinum]|uniref:Site-specific integrase n=1 Tax=Halorarum salinum TaxID=2743089 RepID=A0A7D5LCC0_9EURY|nr:site-specific integrase [Halobaculum salinum]QLG63191.1 site-specific integrase [Halobaculum salinum]
MQTRPYPEKDGLRIWLSRTEWTALLEAVDDEPRRRIALQLGLHGLRTHELLQVEPRHVRALANGADGHVLTVEDGKTGKRELPVSADLVERIRYLKSAARMRQDEPIVDVSKRTVRNWIASARDVLVDPNLEENPAGALGMHDLRRTWATDSYYSLAFAGVPIAEQLVMSWGGWAQTSTGRETFRQNYLGPVPDHVTAQTFDELPLA